MDLNSRERIVLESIVEIYLHNGQPVASKQVAAQPRQRLSPASIRSVMARLEERELVSRAHTSAGCVPTDVGLRCHLDQHLGKSKPSPVLRREVQAQFGSVQRELTEGMDWVARLAADLTNEAGIVVRPVGEEPAFEAMTLVDLGGGKVLGVVVTADGRVFRHVAPCDESVSFDNLRRVAIRVSAELKGQGLDQVRSAMLRLPVADRSVTSVELDVLLDLLPPAEISEVRVVGTENLIDDEAFAEVESLRSVVKVLGDRPGIAHEWRKALRSKATRVFIGKESRLTEYGNLGMVATLFYRGTRSVGAVGVVGPRGMDYRRVVPVVECIGESLSCFLSA